MTTAMTDMWNGNREQRDDHDGQKEPVNHITEVPGVDEAVADHLVEPVGAFRLMGANAIITGLSSEIAQTLATIGVDLTKMNTVGDLEGGIEEPERTLGCRVTRNLDARR